VNPPPALFLAMFVPSELPQPGRPGMQLLGTLRHEVRAVLQHRGQLLNLGSDTTRDRATCPASFRARRISASAFPTAEPF
jgi:hypothetical protein